MIEEKNPMCMLPAPLNSLTTLFFPLHYFVLTRYADSSATETVVSVCGTVADWILGLIFSFIAPSIEFLVALRVIIYDGDGITTKKFVEVLCFICIFPVISFAFTCKSDVLITFSKLITKFTF